MRTLIATIFALISFTMVSCSDADEMFMDNVPAQNAKNGTRTDAEDAYVRFAMYANINGYNVKVKNLRVENCMNPNNVPAIGNAITQAQYLPTTAAEAIFDNANGKYNTVETSNEESWVVLHFDIEMTATANFESKMAIKDVKYYISPKDASWKSGEYYDYVVKVDAEFLGLSEINFGADVEDFQNGNDANVDC